MMLIFVRRFCPVPEVVQEAVELENMAVRGVVLVVRSMEPEETISVTGAFVSLSKSIPTLSPKLYMNRLV